VCAWRSSSAVRIRRRPPLCRRRHGGDLREHGGGSWRQEDSDERLAGPLPALGSPHERGRRGGNPRTLLKNGENHCRDRESDQPGACTRKAHSWHHCWKCWKCSRSRCCRCGGCCATCPRKQAAGCSSVATLERPLQRPCAVHGREHLGGRRPMHAAAAQRSRRRRMEIRNGGTEIANESNTE
jgi:hypothetical protein